MPLKQIAIGALPVAIGAAIQVSGFGGETAVLTGWGSVALALAVLAAHYVWERRRSAVRSAARLARKLGRDLVHFVQTRHAVAPSHRPEQPWIRRVRDVLRGPARGDSNHAYETDTMSLFHERFADSVLDVVAKLRRARRIGTAEAKDLISMPTGPAAIERLGRRLIELGYED